MIVDSPPAMTAPSEADRPGFAGEYPFASHFLNLDGLRYHYLDEGPRQRSTGSGEEAPSDAAAAAPTLLFVHGNPTWSFAWRRLIRELRGEYRCVAVDHIGCGLSDKPQDYDYTLARHIENLSRLIEQLDLRNVTLIAHDWGGCIGMGAAGRLPERFSRFVLMNTAAFRSTRIPWRIAVCRVPVLGAIGVRGFNLFARAALWMAVSDRSHLSAAARRGLLAPYDSWGHRIAIHRFVQDIPLKPSHPSYETLRQVEESLSQFRASPMLLVWGMQDWCFTPEFLQEWEQRFPTAEVHRLAGASHYVFEDAPDEVPARIRGFLQRGMPC
jgi:pimeloyl-ACP methyl ester carboxylesterase